MDEEMALLGQRREKLARQIGSIRGRQIDSVVERQRLAAAAEAFRVHLGRGRPKPPAPPLPADDGKSPLMAARGAVG